jgi:hypothetical protein
MQIRCLISIFARFSQTNLYNIQITKHTSGYMHSKVAHFQRMLHSLKVHMVVLKC